MVLAGQWKKGPGLLLPHVLSCLSFPGDCTGEHGATGECTTRVLGQRPDSRGSNMSGAATHPKKANGSNGERQERISSAWLLCLGRLGRHFSPSPGTDMSLRFKWKTNWARDNPGKVWSGQSLSQFWSCMEAQRSPYCLRGQSVPMRSLLLLRGDLIIG
jgi:hypothetical protein